jgi:hypothetical protein
MLRDRMQKLSDESLRSEILFCYRCIQTAVGGSVIARLERRVAAAEAEVESRRVTVGGAR